MSVYLPNDKVWVRAHDVGPHPNGVPAPSTPVLCKFEDIRAQLKDAHACMVSKITAIRLWTPMARLIAAGQWPCDLIPVTARPSRALAEDAAWEKPSSDTIRRLFNEHSKMVPEAEAEDPADEVCVEKVVHAPVPYKGTTNGKFVRFDGIHILRAIEVSENLRDKGTLGVTLSACLKYAFPEEYKTSQAKLKDAGFVNPSRWTLIRARQQLDVTAMGMHRVIARTQPPAFKYLNFDASPIRGVEVFGIKESLLFKATHNPSMRDMPIQILAHKCTGITDKSLCIMNAVFLEYGPTLEQMRTYFRSRGWWCSVFRESRDRAGVRSVT